MTLLVRLTDPLVEVWRPVDNAEIGERVRLIIPGQAMPRDEEWEFKLGEQVKTEVRSRTEFAILWRFATMKERSRIWRSRRRRSSIGSMKRKRWFIA